MNARDHFHACVLAAIPCFVLHLLAAGLAGPLDILWPLHLTAFGAMFMVPAGLEVLRRCEIADLRLHPALLVVTWLGMAAAAAGITYWPAAAGWLLVTLLIAVRAAMSFLASPRTLARTITLAGPAMLVVGGAWYFADRAGLKPLDFDFLIVRLTAAHFHFAGFVLPIATGLLLLHWQIPARWLRVSSIGVIAGVPLVAAGITLTRMGAAAEWECTFAAGLAFCALVTGLSQVVLAWKSPAQSVTVRMLLALSGLNLTAGMALALLYALRLWLPLPWLHLPRMWAWHGSINVFGFALPGMIAWLLWRRSPAPGATA